MAFQLSRRFALLVGGNVPVQLFHIFGMGLFLLAGQHVEDLAFVEVPRNQGIFLAPVTLQSRQCIILVGLGLFGVATRDPVP